MFELYAVYFLTTDVIQCSSLKSKKMNSLTHQQRLGTPRGGQLAHKVKNYKVKKIILKISIVLSFFIVYPVKPLRAENYETDQQPIFTHHHFITLPEFAGLKNLLIIPCIAI